MDSLSDDLTRLSPDDRLRVCRWAEDRFVNAVCALDMQLQREMPGVMAADRTLQIAKAAVAKVLAGVEEARALARRDLPAGAAQAGRAR